MTRHAAVILSIATFFLSTVTAHQRLPGPYTIFKTEPSFVPSNIKVTHHTNERHLLAPGYTFIAPHIVTLGFGPQIIDQDGNLVWYGLPTVSRFHGNPVYAAPVFICDFMGQKLQHLCYSESHPSGYESLGIREGGAHRIFDNTYQQIGEEFSELGDLKTTPNAHEFNVLPGGHTFIQAVSPIRSRDLTPYLGSRNGWIEDGCFQEIDMYTRTVLFQWCFSDHYPVWETYFYLSIPENKVNISSPSGGEGSKLKPWDFMHINAIDKNEEGDYLVSSRHLSQILKIAGPNSSSGLKPGATIWRLNGRHSDFKFTQEEARFARQHCCRFLSTGQNETLIYFFDNADNGTYTKPDRSSAKILRLNNATMEASLEAIYKHPKAHIAYAQGSAFVLPGNRGEGSRGNMHVGWGALPEWSEFTPNGTLLFHAEIWADKSQYERRLTNYRSFKFPWVAKPHYPPKLVAYMQRCPSEDFSTPIVTYLSWNGATEVGKWRLYTSETRVGPRTLVGTVDKMGFETKAELPPVNMNSSSAGWMTVEAIDKTDGHTVLGMATSRMFVPPSRWRDHCDVSGCFHNTRYDYNTMDSLRCVKQPGSSKIFQLAFFIFAIECISGVIWLPFSVRSKRRAFARARGRYAKVRFR